MPSNICRKKKYYEKWQADEAKRVNMAKFHQPFSVYYCVHCDSFHLTSNTDFLDPDDIALFNLEFRNAKPLTN